MNELAQNKAFLGTVRLRLSSTGEAAPTGSVPHSEPIVSTVRHVTGTGTGLLGGNP